MLRTLPQVAKRLSAREVVRRWLTITKMAKCLSDDLPVPDPKRVEKMAEGQRVGAEAAAQAEQHFLVHGHPLREHCPARANREDGCSGRFWETRYRCRECTDLSAVLLCGIYVDLNPYRAGEVDSPLASRYTLGVSASAGQGHAEERGRPARRLAG